MKKTRFFNEFNISHRFHYLRYLKICSLDSAKKAASNDKRFILCTCSVIEQLWVTRGHPSIRHGPLSKMHQLSLASFFIQ